ncbi:MAG TPA: hypothetical protein PLB90_15845 [Opitutaceae bacterium]|nr:hypothetical protein [Opitutaceae bacterium]
MSRPTRRLLFAAKFVLGCAAAALALTAFIAATAAFLRPDLSRRPALPSAPPRWPHSARADWSDW